MAICAACAGPAPKPVPPPPPPPPPPPVDAAPPPIDAPPPAPLVTGDRCDATRACDDGRACLGWSGGYCAAACADRTCAAEGTSCVATPAVGAVCAKSCASDRDCRYDEGYVCDAEWHACLLPNTAAVVPKVCVPKKPVGNDPAFGEPEDFGPGTDPVAALGNRGLVSGWKGGRNDPELYLGVGERALRDSGGAGVLAVYVRGEERDVEAERNGIGIGSKLQDADCKGDDTCPERPLIASNKLGVFVAFSGEAIGTRVRMGHASDFGPAVTALAGTRGDLATSSDGRVHVVGMRGGLGGAYGAAQHVIEYAVSKDGAKTFTKAVTVSARDEVIPAYFAGPVLAVDDKREMIYVAYIRGGRDGVWDLVIASSKDKGVTWTRTVVSDGCALRMEPAIAVDPATGILHVALYDTTASPARFAHLACSGGTCGDRGAISRAPFASLDTGRKDARWVGERQALLVDDTNRQLHAVWAQPVAGADGAVTMHVFHAVAKLAPATR